MVPFSRDYGYFPMSVLSTCCKKAPMFTYVGKTKQKFSEAATVTLDIVFWGVGGYCTKIASQQSF